MLKSKVPFYYTTNSGKKHFTSWTQPTRRTALSVLRRYRVTGLSAPPCPYTSLLFRPGISSLLGPQVPTLLPLQGTAPSASPQGSSQRRPNSTDRKAQAAWKWRVLPHLTVPEPYKLICFLPLIRNIYRYMNSSTRNFLAFAQKLYSGLYSQRAYNVRCRGETQL